MLTIIDDQIAAHLRRNPRVDMPVGDERLWALQSRLVYTPHALVGHNKAACHYCGSERRWGNSVVY